MYGSNLSWWAGLVPKSQQFSSFIVQLAPTSHPPKRWVLIMLRPFSFVLFFCLVLPWCLLSPCASDILKPQNSPPNLVIGMHIYIYISLSLSFCLSLSLYHFFFFFFLSLSAPFSLTPSHTLSLSLWSSLSMSLFGVLSLSLSLSRALLHKPLSESSPASWGAWLGWSRIPGVASALLKEDLRYACLSGQMGRNEPQRVLGASLRKARREGGGCQRKCLSDRSQPLEGYFGARLPLLWLETRGMLSEMIIVDFGTPPSLLLNLAFCQFFLEK